MALAEFIVLFRETFEIALVVGIMLAYLYKTKNYRFSSFIYLGAALALAASLGAAWGFETLAGGFEQNEALFEGITLVAACALVTWLILWMFAQRNVARKIEEGLRVKIGHRERAGLAAFAFIAVFREGIEIVLFLFGIQISSGGLSLAAAAAGAAAALALAYAFFRRAIRLDMRAFFTYTSAILVLLAAGLLSQGVHELQEAKAIPTSVERIYDITPPLSADGSYPLLHEKGAIGSLLKGLVGYDTAPSLEQAAAYIAYLGFVYLSYRRIPKA